jgi:multiple sugar transport system permease protein
MTSLSDTTTASRTSGPGTVVHHQTKPGINWGRVLAWTALTIAILLTLFPFFWMIRTAFSNTKMLPQHPNSLLPVGFTLGAFKRVLGLATQQEAIAQGGSGASVNFWLFLRNSVIYATLVTVGQVFFSALAAYAFSRLRWPGRDLVFYAFLSALIIPPIFTVLPNFILIKNLGLLNTYAGMVLPFILMTPFAIFFLRQFFLGINREIEEAAKIDGAGHWRIFFRIILPMSVAPMTTLGMLTYINAWNDYFWPLLVGGTDGTRVLTVAIGVFRAQTPGGSLDWAGLMAATLVAALPILVLFFAFARKIVDGIGFSGIK